MTQPETSLRDLVGEQFGPYRLVRRLGVGGMAETFEAIRRGPNEFEQRVCIKLVLPFHQQNEDFIELFHREAKLAARLRHSNIVGVIDYGEVDGKSYMALELIDGCDLRALLDTQDRTRLSPDYVTLIGLDIAAALEHAHNPGAQEPGDSSGSVPRSIIHRDISPSNVLISRFGEVLLTDFGVAKAITGTARKQSAIKGKIPYMSSEQLRGDDIDGRSDLFALGVVMFEALAGQRPYDGPNEPATILRTLSGEHPSLKSLATDSPPELCDIVESLLDPEPAKRPQTASELIEALDRFAPSRRTRRTLGEMAAETPTAFEPLVPEVSSAVEERQRGSEDETGVGKKKPRIPDPEAATARIGDASEPEGRQAEERQAAEEAPRSKRKVGAWLAVAALAIAVGLGVFALWPSDAGNEAPTSESQAATIRDPAEAPSEAPPPTVSAEAIPEGEPAPSVESPTAAPAPAEASKSTPPPAVTPAAPAPARLTVIAIPWGDVWIDGQKAGSSPLKNVRLKPGRYEISAGQGRPSKSQTIRLRAGQRRTVKFDLTD